MIGAHNTDYVTSFYNDRVKELMPVQDMQEPFTFVPIRAGHMELVGGNAVVFGKITEGYDEINPIIGTNIEFRDVSSDAASIGMAIGILLIDFSREVSPDGTIHYRVYDCVMTIHVPLLEVYIGSNYSIVLKSSAGGVDIAVNYVAAPGDTPTMVKEALEGLLTAAGVPVSAGWSWQPIMVYRRERKYIDLPWEHYQAGDCSTSYKDFNIDIDTVANILVLGNTVKLGINKCGAIHGYGLVYKDRAGRQCSVMKNDLFSIYIPFYTEDVDNLLGSVADITFYLTNKPPDWAESYEIVYFGNMSMDWFMQIRIDAISSLGEDKYTINIQDTISWAREQNNRIRVPDYVWTEGDRIRLIGTIDAVTGVVTKYDEAYDYEIDETATEDGADVEGDYLVIQAINQPTDFEGEDNIIAEIYRPRKGLAKTIPYGCGMVFDIGVDDNGNRYHKGDVDQIISADGEVLSSVEIINTSNDSYKFPRVNYRHDSAIIWPFWAESIWPSDWWTWAVANKLTNNGFPFLDDLSQRQVELDERIRHGGFIITGTRTNNIAHFTFEDYKDLAKKDGDITGLREVGYVLKVIQLYKETSIYINRIQNFSADGTENFTLTDAFLGTIYPLETSYGCQHPDSIMVNGRNLYYWDNSEGKFIRSAPNGQLVLDKKVKRWYKDLLTWIQNNGGGSLLQVRTGMNIDHDEVWVSFRMGDDAKGMIFSEKDGRYKSRINLKTETYIHLGAFFAHLYRQRIWIMNVDEGQDYLSWVGEPVDGEIEFVSNIEPSKNKIFNAIAVYSDHQWQSISKSLVIPEEASAVNEIMESNISVWDRREGIYYGEILKDENSKGNFVSVNDKKMNGREMRGRYCFVRLKTSEHDEKVRIDSIVISSTGSERTV